MKKLEIPDINKIKPWTLHPQKASLRSARKAVKKFRKIFDDRIVIDPFAGVGTLLFAVYLHAKPKRLIAIELEEKYARWGKQFQEYLGIPHNAVEWHVGDSIRVLPTIEKYDVVFTSPPGIPVGFQPGGCIRHILKSGLKWPVLKIIAMPENKNNPMGKKRCELVSNKVVAMAEKKAEIIVLWNQAYGYVPIRSTFTLVHRELVKAEVAQGSKGAWLEIYMKHPEQWAKLKPRDITSWLGGDDG